MKARSPLAGTQAPAGRIPGPCTPGPWPPLTGPQVLAGRASGTRWPDLVGLAHAGPPMTGPSLAGPQFPGPRRPESRTRLVGPPFSGARAPVGGAPGPELPGPGPPLAKPWAPARRALCLRTGSGPPLAGTRLAGPRAPVGRAPGLRWEGPWPHWQGSGHPLSGPRSSACRAPNLCWSGPGLPPAWPPLAGPVDSVHWALLAGLPAPVERAPTGRVPACQIPAGRPFDGRASGPRFSGPSLARPCLPISPAGRPPLFGPQVPHNWVLAGGAPGSRVFADRDPGPCWPGHWLPYARPWAPAGRTLLAGSPRAGLRGLARIPTGRAFDCRASASQAPAARAPADRASASEALVGRAPASAIRGPYPTSQAPGPHWLDPWPPLI